MRRLTLLGYLLCATFLLPEIGLGQETEPPANPSPASTPFEPSKLNAGRLRWLEYKMVSGRIVATSSYPEGMNISFGPSVVFGGLREGLQLAIFRDHARVRYELTGGGQELMIALGQEQAFSLRRKHADPKVLVRYIQQAGQPIYFSVQQDGSEQILQGDSFWHLYLANPELVRRHVVGQLEMLNPAWQLNALGAGIEDALFQRGESPQLVATDRWSQLVKLLASPKFAERQNAERELRREGQAVLPFLQDLDPQELDAEQASRIRSLVDALSVDYADTTDRIATWLAADPQVWLSLMTRAEPAKRQIAAKQFAAIVGQPLDFDPLAEESVGTKQWERLRARYGKPLLPAPSPMVDAPATGSVEGPTPIPVYGTPSRLVPPPRVDR